MGIDQKHVAAACVFRKPPFHQISNVLFQILLEVVESGNIKNKNFSGVIDRLPVMDAFTLCLIWSDLVQPVRLAACRDTCYCQGDNECPIYMYDCAFHMIFIFKCKYNIFDIISTFVEYCDNVNTKRYETYRKNDYVFGNSFGCCLMCR